MRERLWPEEPPEYTGTRDNFDSSNHAMRALVSGAMIATIAPKTVIDPACGDASILEVAHRLRPIEFGYLADISQAQIDAIEPSFEHVKVCSDLMHVLEVAQHFDVIVLTEILEHLKDPDAALRSARGRAQFLLASSPIGDNEDGRNREHLWAWDEVGYAEMLSTAGWTPIAKQVQSFPGSPWTDQLWLAT